MEERLVQREIQNEMKKLTKKALIKADKSRQSEMPKSQFFKIIEE